MSTRHDELLRPLALAPELTASWRVEIADDGDRLVCFAQSVDLDQQAARNRAEDLSRAVDSAEGVRATRAWAASYLGPPGRWRGVLEILIDPNATDVPFEPVPA